MNKELAEQLSKRLKESLISCSLLAIERNINIDELYLKNIDKEKLIEVSKVSPKNTRELVENVVSRI